MADDATNPNSEEEELVLGEEDQVDAPEGGEADDPPPPGDDQPDEDEDTIVIGDGTEAEAGDSGLVQHLREQLKKAQKEAAEARKAAPAPKPIEVGPKPDLWDDDIAGDPDIYDKRMDEWRDRKAAVERQVEEQGKAAEREREVWAGEIQRYEDGKAALGFKDMGEAEDTVKTTLNPVQQAVLISAASDSAKVLYALGKNADKLAQLASIEDPIKFAAAIARLEGTLKVVKRRRAPDPDTPERGSAPASKPAADKTLERLEAEADRTGDRSKIIQYKREQRRKANG